MVRSDIMKTNCASHALKTDYVVLETSQMRKDPIAYLNSVYVQYNRKLRLLGRDFSQLAEYERQLQNEEWMVVFWGPYSSSRFHDPDDYSSLLSFYPDEQFHFIIRETHERWSQMDLGDSSPCTARIESEIKNFASKGYTPYFIAVSLISNDAG